MESEVNYVSLTKTFGKRINMNKIAKQLYIEYLIEQADNNTFIKEHATVGEFERFKNMS